MEEASQEVAAGQAADTAAVHDQAADTVALDRVVGSEAIGAPPSVNRDRPLNHPLGPVVDRRSPVVRQEAHREQAGQGWVHLEQVAPESVHLAQVAPELALRERVGRESALLESAHLAQVALASARRESAHQELGARELALQESVHLELVVQVSALRESDRQDLEPGRVRESEPVSRPELELRREPESVLAWPVDKVHYQVWAQTEQHLSPIDAPICNPNLIKAPNDPLIVCRTVKAIARIT